MARTPKGLFLPELLEPEPGPWSVTEVQIRDSAVDLQQRRAWVPRAHTEAQKLARRHELGHTKYSPRNWLRMAREVMALATEEEEPIDPGVALRISKMLEENRIDWLLWDKHSIDLRPCREALDWSGVPVPTDPLAALNWVLQLAWTVWASRGLGSGIPNKPPERACDEATGAFFDSCWDVLENHNPALITAIVRGCLAMYETPTHSCRNQVAAELSTFFPPKKEEEQPPEKQEEKEAREKAEAEEEAAERMHEEEEGGVGADPESHGYWDLHDHTKGIRRPSVRIVRRETPQFVGTKFTFAHRYMLDKAVFARRTVTEGGIMIDGSGSMQWHNENLQAILAKLPAVTVGIYHGFVHHASTRRLGSFGVGQGGRVCVLAKQGRFCIYNERDPGYNADNAVDVEALRVLATWPRPRLWLSDGFACGGHFSGPHPDPRWNTTDFMRAEGNVIFECTKVMMAHEILRVPDIKTLEALLQRKRVTLFRTPVSHTDSGYYFPSNMPESPIQFQL